MKGFSSHNYGLVTSQVSFNTSLSEECTFLVNLILQAWGASEGTQNYLDFIPSPQTPLELNHCTF